MGSGYYGESNFGNGSNRGGSSKKGKKSNSSEKPKQPQRGLGVAQLEKIRLQGQLGNSYHPFIHGSYPTNLNQGDTGVQTANYSSILHPPFSCSTLLPSSLAAYGFHPGFMMGMGECERNNFRYGDSYFMNGVSCDPRRGMMEAQFHAQPSTTKEFLNLHVEESNQKLSRINRSGSLEPSDTSSESSEIQEIDLELRLSR